MKNFLKSHRRTRSAEVSVEPDVPVRKLRTSISFSQMKQQSSSYYKTKDSGSSQSLRKLIPMNLLRKTSFDGYRRNSTSSSARTTPVLSLDECRDCGVIYGTRKHCWGIGNDFDAFTIQEDYIHESEDTESDKNLSYLCEEDPDDIPLSDSDKDFSSSSGTGSSKSQGTLSSISEIPFSDENIDIDKESLFSFDDNEGLGRNRSINFYKTDPKTQTENQKETQSEDTPNILQLDFEEDDLKYDNFLDEVNAVPGEDEEEEFVNYRWPSNKSSVSILSRSSSGSSRRRKSCCLRKDDTVTTIYSQDFISDDLNDDCRWHASAPIVTNLTPISEGA